MLLWLPVRRAKTDMIRIDLHHHRRLLLTANKRLFCALNSPSRRCQWTRSCAAAAWSRWRLSISSLAFLHPVSMRRNGRGNRVSDSLRPLPRPRGLSRLRVFDGHSLQTISPKPSTGVTLNPTNPVNGRTPCRCETDVDSFGYWQRTPRSIHPACV